jgi:hypothetical protein
MEEEERTQKYPSQVTAKTIYANQIKYIITCLKKIHYTGEEKQNKIERNIYRGEEKEEEIN